MSVATNQHCSENHKTFVLKKKKVTACSASAQTNQCIHINQRKSKIRTNMPNVFTKFIKAQTKQCIHIMYQSKPNISTNKAIYSHLSKKTKHQHKQTNVFTQFIKPYCLLCNLFVVQLAVQLQLVVCCSECCAAITCLLCKCSRLCS